MAAQADERRVPPDGDLPVVGPGGPDRSGPRARTTKASVRSSYSMIEPPSVPVSRTALLTMLLSTASGSRLELWLAAPTCRSTSNCSTLLASWVPRASRDFIRWTSRSAIAACAANSSSTLTSRSLNGATWARRIDSTPTTSSPGSIGADNRFEPGEPLEVLAAVLRVGEDVVDLLRTPSQCDPAEQAGAAPLQGVVLHVPAELLGNLTRDRDGSGRCAPSRRYSCATSARRSCAARSTMMGRMLLGPAAVPRPNATGGWGWPATAPGRPGAPARGWPPLPPVRRVRTRRRRRGVPPFPRPRSPPRSFHHGFAGPRRQCWGHAHTSWPAEGRSRWRDLVSGETYSPELDFVSP